MTIRPKTKRRVLILLTGLLVFSGAIAWLYAYRMRVAESKLQLDKQVGMAAYRSGDYQTAIDKLAEYISHEQQRDQGQLDPEALLAFANSRAKVPTKNSDDYIVLAIANLRQYCSLVPENTQERDHLLEMEAPSPAYEPDALARANDLLKHNPDDLVALKAIAQIEVRNRKFQEAAPATDRYTQLSPTDLDMQRLNFEILQALSRPAAEMHRRADALRTKYPADPRFLIIKAWAYFYGRNRSETAQQWNDDAEEYKKLILQAAQQDPPTSQFTKTTVPLLDGFGQFGAGLNLLARSCSKFNDPQLTQQLILRLWETRNYQEVITRLKDLDATAPATDAQLIALKAMALYGLADNKSADALVGQLAARGPDDHFALGWSTALKTQFSNPPDDLKTRLAHYRDAQTALPDNGYIAFLLGVSYAEMDETDLALQEWRLACRQMPSWDEPHVRLAMLLVSLGHGASDEASNAAEDATLAGTNANGTVDLRAAVANVKVSFARLSTVSDPTATAALLEEVKQLQTQLPNEPETLPIYVALLTQTGQRTAAIDVIKAACNNLGPDAEDTMMRLVELSRAAKLGMEDELYAAIDRKYGATPRLAYARAMALLNSGGASDGLQLLQSDRDKNKNPADNAFWDRAICQYQEASKDPGAAAAWQKLGETYPSDIGAQTAILTTGESVWSNRAFIKTTIDRLKTLTGDQAIAWKTAQARWLLSGDNSDHDTSDAVVLLTGITTSNPEEYLPHVLLATAYSRLKNFPSALEEWRKAADMAPQSAQAQFNLLQALQNAGRIEEARVQFDRLARVGNLAPDMALVAATMIAAGGDMQRAEGLLTAYPNSTNKVLHDATLAKVYRLENRPNETAAIYFDLIHAKQLDVNTIREAADFFGAARQLPAAHKFLDRLSEIQLPPGQRELILANFEEDRGTVEAAGKLYDEAIKASGNDAVYCARQIEFLMRQRNWSMAQSNLTAAISRWPADQTLPHLQTAVVAFAHFPHADELGSLIEAISRDPQNPAANETIPAATNSATPYTQIQALLEKYPNFQPLYELATRRLMADGRPTDAAAMASKEMGRFSQSIDAARATAEVSAAAGNWNDAIIAARQWRQRVGQDTLAPDIFISKADLFVDQAQDAVDRLTPYLANAKAHADDNQVLLTTYAEALIRAGRESDASALLQPLAKDSAKWRLACLQIAPDAYTDGVMSGRWLEQIRPLLDPKSIDEQASLAEALLSCADRQNFPPDYALAAQALQPFLQSGQMTAAHWMTYASAVTGSGDIASAERAYREAIKVDQNNGVAMNNLADLLRQRGDPASLREAEGLISQAITGHPGDPNLVSYFDTQAQIFLKQGRSSDAIAAFQKGYAVDQRDLNILIGLALTYANTHQIDIAVRYLSQIDNLILPGTHLSSDLQAELDSLRQAIHRNGSQSSVSGADFNPAR
jgi:Tfp pilus assembly protein PilF